MTVQTKSARGTRASIGIAVSFHVFVIMGSNGEKTMLREEKPLKICLLTYRGNPTSGGQGVYIKYLSRALAELGHQVEIISGPPYPHLTGPIPLHELPGLDLYNPDHLFKVQDKKQLLDTLNLGEFLSMCTGGFPEPYTFGVRVSRRFRQLKPAYDIVHDNQCLSPGILSLTGLGYPVVTTIHHPITIDRQMEMSQAHTLLKKIRIARWYHFLRMQKRIARQLRNIITVSQASREDIQREYGLKPETISVVMNGIDTDLFQPLPAVPREPGHLMVTNSADTPLKGLSFLLEAVARIKKTRRVRLTVIGQPKKNGLIENMVRNLGLAETVNFSGRIDSPQFPHYYARASLAVVPSLYEGFGLPAGEAMSCGVPVITTSAGALPEVVGDAGVIVPPADTQSLAEAITALLDDSGRREQLGRAGLDRVQRLFNWRQAAQNTVDVYMDAINADR